MSRKDYTKFSNNKETVDRIQNEVTEVEETIEAQSSVEETIEAQPAVEETIQAQPAVEEVKLKFGFVTGCAKLNVRSKPKIDADILCVIDNATDVEVDENGSTTDFYKIWTSAGVEGYCMKQFIQIK